MVRDVRQIALSNDSLQGAFVKENKMPYFGFLNLVALGHFRTIEKDKHILSVSE